MRGFRASSSSEDFWGSRIVWRIPFAGLGVREGSWLLWWWNRECLPWRRGGGSGGGFEGDGARDEAREEATIALARESTVSWGM